MDAPPLYPPTVSPDHSPLHLAAADCIHAYLDDKSIGESCPHGRKRGSSQYGETSISTFSGFNTAISGKVLRIQITDTPLANGWAVYAIVPTVKTTAVATDTSHIHPGCFTGDGAGKNSGGDILLVSPKVNPSVLVSATPGGKVRRAGF